jgi:hypothetical protein
MQRNHFSTHNSIPPTKDPVEYLDHNDIDHLIIEENPNELDAPAQNIGTSNQRQHNLSEVSEELMSTDMHNQKPQLEGEVIPYNANKEHKLMESQSHTQAQYTCELESENTINEEGKINLCNEQSDKLLPAKLTGITPENTVMMRSKEDSKYSSVVNPLISENSVNDNIKDTLQGGLESKKLKQSEKSNENSRFNEFTTNSSSRECSKKEKLAMEADLAKEAKRIEEKRGSLEKLKLETINKIKQEALLIITNKLPLHLKECIKRRNSNELQKTNNTYEKPLSFNSNFPSPRHQYQTKNDTNLNSSNIQSTITYNSKKSSKSNINTIYSNHKQLVHAISLVLLAGESNASVRAQAVSIIKGLAQNVIILLGPMCNRLEYKGAYVYESEDSIKLVHSLKKCPGVINSHMVKQCYHYDCSCREFKVSGKPMFSNYTDGVTLEYWQ